MKETPGLQAVISRKARVSSGYFFEGNKADRREPSLQKTYLDDTEPPHKRPKLQTTDSHHRKHQEPKLGKGRPGNTKALT